MSNPDGPFPATRLSDPWLRFADIPFPANPDKAAIVRQKTCIFSMIRDKAVVV